MATDDVIPEVPEPDAEARKAWLLKANVARLTAWGWKHLCVRGDRFTGYFLNKQGEIVKWTKPKKADIGRVKLTQTVLQQHFEATGPENVIGGHSLTEPTDEEPQGVGRWANNDWDNHGNLPHVAARNLKHAVHVYRKAAGLGFRPLLCTWGAGGFHLWTLFEGRVPAPILHAFAAWLVADAADFGFTPQVEGDPASGWPEYNPKQPAAKAGKLPSAIRFPGRHYSRDVWPIVFDGTTWLQGGAAVEHVLSLTQQPVTLIPAAAAPGAVTPLGKPKKVQATKTHSLADGPTIRVVCDAEDVFREYNRSVTLDMVVAMHEQFGHHPLISQTATRAEFGRAGAGDGGSRFNVDVRGGVPITYNFSPNTGLPVGDGMSPAEVRCFYTTGRIDKASMREFASVLRQELGIPYRAEPQVPSWSQSASPAGGAEPTESSVEDGAPAETVGPGPTDEPQKQSSPFTESGYTVIAGGTFHCELRRNAETGEVVVADQTKLANFNAKIVCQVTTDDGAEKTSEFLVEVLHSSPNVLPTMVAVPADKFSALDWVMEQLGPLYIISAGKGFKDQLRHAIQELSGKAIRSRVTFTHTGWRKVSKRWVYLHAGGAIGADPGTVDVRLDGAAAGFLLPDPPAGEELRAAVRASLGLLDGLAPDAVTIPLLATTYRAPLGAADYTLWVSGLTGANKSELAALAQQHFGAGMTRTRLPGNWSSTENATEGLAFAVKDAVLVVDDFAPPVTRGEADRLQRTAERLIRGTGNAAGRQRMRADGTLRPPKPPRAMILATGEDVPRGQSIIARLCVAEITRGSVNLTRLSACQADAAAGRYAAAMAGYLEWLAPRYEDMRASFDTDRAAIRDKLLNRFTHARTPDVAANLLMGLRWLLKFAEAVGAITHSEQVALWGRGQAALLDIAGEQNRHQRDTDPVAQFPSLVATVISSGRGHVAGVDGKEPEDASRWGWEVREGAGTYDPRPSYHPRGYKIGWLNGDSQGTLYLDPDATFAAVTKLSQEQGQTFPLGQHTLWRRLKESGLLARTDKNRATYWATVEGARKRLLHVAANTVHQCATSEGVPLDIDDAAHEKSPFSPQKSGFVPTDPLVPPSGGREEGNRGGSDDEYDRIAH